MNWVTALITVWTVHLRFSSCLVISLLISPLCKKHLGFRLVWDLYTLSHPPFRYRLLGLFQLCTFILGLSYKLFITVLTYQTDFSSQRQRYVVLVLTTNNFCSSVCETISKTKKRVRDVEILHLCRKESLFFYLSQSHRTISENLTIYRFRSLLRLNLL